MAELKTALFDYLAQRHFDLMPSAAHDRFEEYDNNGSLIGNMKEWKSRFSGKPLVDLNTSITDPDAWIKLYDACQQTFQKMDKNKQHAYAYGSNYNGATKEFIEKWFGDSTKTFTSSKATDNVNKLLKNLGDFLEANRADLKPRFTTKLSYIFGTVDYDEFYKKLKDGKFNNDFDLRNQVESVIQYITTFGPRPGYPEEPEDEAWPSSLGYDMTGMGGTVNLTDVVLQGLNNMAPAPNPNLDKTKPEDWYEIPNKNELINQFKADYREIFDTLLTNDTIRKHFLEAAADPVKDVLETAIAKTDYENKESDDYLPPMPTDTKNWRQRFKKWKNDTYENHFRRFSDINRGTRKFFSSQAQNIMKGFDKAGIKPTDGLDGILNKKDDTGLRNVINQDPTTRKHFEWFVKTMSVIKEQKPDEYEAALRDGGQLRKIAGYLIAITKPEDVEKAKTALEILSVAKYGLTTSRTMDRLTEATKDMKIFSDDKLSWNKNEGIQLVTKAVDKTAGLALRGVGLVATGIHNFIQHRRTKIKNTISKDSDLGKAYQKWEDEDSLKYANMLASNARHHVTSNLITLATGGGLSGRVIANDAQMEAAQADWMLMSPGVDRDNLEADIKLYSDASKRKALEDPDNWREKNPDYMSELAAHWNMLETFGKTHSLLLGSMAVKRKAMFEKDPVSQKTHAKIVAENYYQKFGNLRAA